MQHYSSNVSLFYVICMITEMINTIVFAHSIESIDIQRIRFFNNVSYPKMEFVNMKKEQISYPYIYSLLMKNSTSF